MAPTYHDILWTCKIKCYPIFLDALDSLSWHTYTICFTLACKRWTCATPQGHGHLFFLFWKCSPVQSLSYCGSLGGWKAPRPICHYELIPCLPHCLWLSLSVSLCFSCIYLRLRPCKIVFSNIMNMHSADKLCVSLNNRAVTGFLSASVLSLSVWLFSAHTGR